MVRTASVVLGVSLFLALATGFETVDAAGLVIDHNNTDLTALSLASVARAKAELHIAYGHTSHGSQVTTGMTAMNGFINGGGLGMSCTADTFRWHDGELTGALDLDDCFMPGDLGNPNRTEWAARTETYLDDPANSDVNVVMWSWCGQADTSEANIATYLNLMTQLENKYADVTFVYMTGHVNGCSTTGNLFLRNQQIRDYCTANDKVLYDFADIESWDPDGNYYGDKLVQDDCDYDSDGNGVVDPEVDDNWATDWQDAHTEGVDWFNCSPAHTKPLNGNQKAYAAWSLWTSLVMVMPGDTNGDNAVDETDAAVLAEHWGHGDVGWDQGDFDGDGHVGLADAAILAANWTAGSGGDATPVPELSVAVMLIAGLWGLLAGRRAKHLR
jgi:hypothetical protein